MAFACLAGLSAANATWKCKEMQICWRVTLHFSVIKNEANYNYLFCRPQPWTLSGSSKLPGSCAQSWSPKLWVVISHHTLPPNQHLPHTTLSLSWCLCFLLPLGAIQWDVIRTIKGTSLCCPHLYATLCRPTTVERWPCSCKKDPSLCTKPHPFLPAGGNYPEIVTHQPFYFLFMCSSCF